MNPFGIREMCFALEIRLTASEMLASIKIEDIGAFKVPMSSLFCLFLYIKYIDFYLSVEYN